MIEKKESLYGKVNNKTGLSVIIPFLNEAESIYDFCKTMDEYVLTLPFPVEFIFVNDGSTDDSVERLLNFRFQNLSAVQLVNLSRNFGSQAAIRAGISKAKYDICTWFSIDMQEPKEILLLSFEKIYNGKLEAVYFEKKTVGVSKVNRFFSKTYSYLMKKYAVANYSRNGTATIAFGKKIKKFLNENMEANSEITLQIMDAGFEYEIIALDYGKRLKGTSKWTFSKKIKLFIDSFVAFSFAPIRLVSLVGGLIFILGIIIGMATIINRFVNPDVPLGYSTLASITALGFGVTNISLGIIAEYLWRTYDAARKRPVFIVSDVVTIKECESDTQ